MNSYAHLILLSILASPARTIMLCLCWAISSRIQSAPYQYNHLPQNPATRCFMLSFGHISHTSSSIVRCFSTTPIAWPALVTLLVSFSCNPPRAPLPCDPGWAVVGFDDDVGFSLFLAKQDQPKLGWVSWHKRVFMVHSSNMISRWYPLGGTTIDWSITKWWF